MTTLLSEHFTLDEFTVSETAARRGISNAPPPAIRERLKATAEKMERVRAILGGNPIRISSGYRSPAVNAAVGGSVTSHHTQGYAVDFICPLFGDPLAVCKAIAASDLAFDQIIHEFSQWCHLSFHPRGRRQLLTIDSLGTRLGLFTARKRAA